jgi:hypothetical protein
MSGLPPIFADLPFSYHRRDLECQSPSRPERSSAAITTLAFCAALAM